MSDLWDYLLIFENGARNIFDTMAQFMKIPSQKIIYALDWYSWANHPAAVYSMLNPQGGGAVRVSSFESQYGAAIQLLHDLYNA